MSVLDVLKYLESSSSTKQTFANGTVTFLTKITPDIARELLKANTVNRSINKANVKKFSENIKTNTWIPTLNTIKFSHNGILLDGQHRLGGVIESRIPAIEMLFHTGLDPETVNEIDTGCGKRKTSDIAQIEMRIEGKHAQAAMLKKLVPSLNVINNTLNMSDVRDPKELQRLYYILQSECDLIYDILFTRVSKMGIGNRRSAVGAAMIGAKLLIPDADYELDLASQLLLYGKRKSGESAREDYTICPNMLKRITEDRGKGGNQASRVDVFKESLFYLVEYAKGHEVNTPTLIATKTYFERYLDALRNKLEEGEE